MSIDKQRASKTSSSDFYGTKGLHQSSLNTAPETNKDSAKMSLSKRLSLLQEKVHLRKIKQI